MFSSGHSFLKSLRDARHLYDSFFYSIQSGLRKHWFDSTHDSNPRLKMDYWNLFQIDSRLKKPPEFWFKSTHDSKNFWFDSTHDWMMLFILSFVWPICGIQLNYWLGWPFFGLSTQVLISYDLFWAFDSKAAPDKLIWISSWLKQHLVDLNRFNSWLKGLSRNWLKINSG